MSSNVGASVPTLAASCCTFHDWRRTIQSFAKRTGGTQCDFDTMRAAKAQVQHEVL
jgi:hypothetical protein